MMNRRTLLKGVATGTGGLLLSPLLQKVAAQASGNVAPPKRVIFLVFDNGFKDTGALPVDTPIASNTLRQFSIRDHRLPFDIEPFAPFKDRLTLVHGLRGAGAVDHGGYFTALSGIPGPKHSALGQSIDAAIAQVRPGVFPMLGLGAHNNGPMTAYCSSAWGPGRPIAMMCRPEMAYESLFGSVGSTRNDFAIRRNLLDHVTGDLQRVRSEIAGPERELLDAHLESIESLSRRNGQLADQFRNGTLNRHAPTLPTRPVLGGVADTLSTQCDIAAAALIAGLTNVVTISSGLGGLMGGYAGIPGIEGVDGHGAGHGGIYPGLGLTTVFRALSLYHNFLAQQAARMLTRLQETREGNGTMLDNTVLVFMSDSANQQHSWRNASWPIVLVGNLGGTLRTGQFVSYPVRSQAAGGDGGGQIFGTAHESNPYTNALFCTLLHAVGSPRDTFNRSSNSTEAPALYGPLRELLA